jgi:cytochrome bd-type quinol oxidase subunit 2
VLKKIKQLITIAAFGLAAAVPFAAAGSVHAGAPDIQGQLNQGTCLSTTDTSCAATDAEGTVNSLIEDVINIFSLVVGVVSVIMIIIGGFQYITSAGDSNKVGTAKNTILYAIIGLVIVALAQFIVRFVLGRVTDASN